MDYTVTIDKAGAQGIVANYEEVNEASDRYGREWVKLLDEKRTGIVGLWEGDELIDKYTVNARAIEGYWWREPGL